jgi:hypothetical protein
MVINQITDILHIAVDRFDGRDVDDTGFSRSKKYTFW